MTRTKTSSVFGKRKRSLEVNQMRTSSAPGTNRMIEHIKGLQRKMGIKGENNKQLNNMEASRLISDLVSGLNSGPDLRSQINEPRLGLAMKECFRLWKNNGWDIYKKHRKAFITDAVDAYRLFSEIAQKLEANRRAGK
jgi:hypothetical protein